MENTEKNKQITAIADEKIGKVLSGAVENLNNKYDDVYSYEYSVNLENNTILFRLALFVNGNNFANHEHRTTLPIEDNGIGVEATAKGITKGIISKALGSMREDGEAEIRDCTTLLNLIKPAVC